MTKAETPSPDGARTRILLVGAGHANVHVLEAFGKRPEASVELTLVTPHERTPYSGSLPGYLAGFYSIEEMTIDAKGLAGFAGADLHLQKVAMIDPRARLARLDDGTCLAFDILALDIGSEPGMGGARTGVPVKPIDRFATSVDALLQETKEGSGPFRLAIVGTGAAGVELAFAFAARLPAAIGPRPFQLTLIGEANEILPDRAPRTRRRLTERLAEKNIGLVLGARVARTLPDRLMLENGAVIGADAIVWATTSAAQGWLRETGLELDATGFVRVDAMLRSRSHPHIFAAGDVASLPDPRPKAGVFAVREGPVLATNLRRLARGEALETFAPQKDWLNLLSTGDGRAVADKWGVSLEGRWIWHWKDWNDRRFVERFNRLAAQGRRAHRG
ncbi:FAD-dependent oxidoreductase [Fulvimarina sp. 2208YS6-2-32]|uniref:FAD-dependent oxidoreductase n=1 Tax=Fulvimarina uroteuthidis TaxID=3098149 RepID=A0ABU5I5D0_9HYPH|nr:FAD-dependent oxidoreductase [Fulvimarina sp. 2208YS6-2-32]MDY8110004.1 FAD-dependent oxidoreductase [Fulvimarina sp. 2208YS6-2-32]